MNIPKSILEKRGLQLHNNIQHPLGIIKKTIYEYFNNLPDMYFETFDDFSPEVHIRDNFDLLLIPETHPSRSKSDTYYLDESNVLRTHTSAHQNELLSKNLTSFLVTGDVYRKDEIDARHYPIFHQMEGVHLVSDEIDPEEELKRVLGGLVEYLFPGKEYRFNNDYFPFTEPSFEIEVMFGDKWLEILGCGIIHPTILAHHGIKQRGWAFGLGLERFAMILFNIPDIRLFWSTDPKFMSQFIDGKIVVFQPFCKIDSKRKDISFWIPENEVEIKENDFSWKKVNDFYEMVREICGDTIESVVLLDHFFHTGKQKYSVTFKLQIGALKSSEKNDSEVTKHANKCIDQIRNILINDGYIVR